jgi:DNA-binding response OmpR family regulator
LADLKHILVIDAESSVRETIAAMLEAAGYRISALGDRASALQLLGDGISIDAIVMDAVNPTKLNGSLATYATELGVPVVMISGRDEMMNAAFDEGLQLLHKPFTMRALLDSLATALDSHTAGWRSASE